MKPEEIFEKHAKKNMYEWNQLSFSITHKRLYKSILDAIDEALNAPTVY